MTRFPEFDIPEPRDAEAPISMERRCQVPGCRAVFIAPALGELRCPSCRAARRRAPQPGRSLHGCTAARCAGA